MKDIRRKRLPEYNPTTLEFLEEDKPSEVGGASITLKLRDGREV